MNRPLTELEHAFWLFDQGKSQNFVIVARLLNCAEALNEPVLRQALNFLQQRHPPLRCKFKDGDVPQYCSEGVPQIPFRFIDRTNDEYWIEVVEREIEEQFPWTIGPLVRVVVLKSQDKCDLLVTFCHIIADATSGVNVVREILNYVDKLNRKEPITALSSLPELPATHDMIRKDIKFRPTFLDFSGWIQRVFHTPVALQGDQNVTHEKRVTRIIPKELSPSETKTLINNCKKNKVSVHATLCAALLQTIAEEIRKSHTVRGKKPLMIGCLTPVNIRHLFSITLGDDVGNFIADAFHYQLINENSSIWAVAKKVKESINREIKFGRYIKDVQNIGELLAENSTPRDMLQAIAQSVPPIFVTNMGNIDIPGVYGNIILESIHFALSLNPAAKDGFAVAVTTYRGSMILNFQYAEPYLAKERAIEMAEKTFHRLKNAVGENS